MTLKSYKDEEKQRQSNWVREIVQDTCPVEEYVLETIKKKPAKFASSQKDHTLSDNE
jgi:hypothetical protein